MVYLEGWQRMLQSGARNDSRITVLDHGPIYRLCALREFGPELTQSEVYASWWNDMLVRWGVILDLVVWLDAPDPILLERINARAEAHSVKGKSEGEAFRFFARYRAGYQHVVDRMTAIGGPRLIRFDTQETSLEAAVNEVITALDGQGIGRRAKNVAPERRA